MLKVARFVRYEDNICRVEIMWMPLWRLAAIEVLDRLNPSTFLTEERLGEFSGAVAERMHAAVTKLEARSAAASVAVSEEWARQYFDWNLDEADA